MNLESERWCGGCGMLLGVGDLGERRQLTVLFCDLVGSTELSTKLDAEELRDLITLFQGVCAKAITRAGGFIARYMGDGILAYFGWPTATEDAAERAIRAGLEVVEAVQDNQAGLREQARRDDIEIRVRAGIATGQVVVGDLIGEGAAEERAVVGETPNLAARLQGLASPNHVVVSATTRALVGELFEFESLGEHALKGFPDPVTAWCVSGAAAVESRFAGRHANVAPLVGRDAELSVLLEKWRRATQGHGHTVVIEAEAGFGKSRLAEGLRDATASDQRAYIVLQCSPYHMSTALHPLVEHLQRTLADTQPAELTATFALSQERAARAMRTVAMLLGMDDPTPDLPPPTQDEFLDSAADILLSEAATRPAMVIIEDAQWLDPSGLALTRELVRRAPQQPLLLVVTQRPGVQVVREPDDTVTLLRLDRLGPEAVAQLVDAVAGELVSGDMRARIAERGEGVPLFIEELARSASSGGRDVPATLADALMARLDEDGTSRQIAQAASVLGREFSVKVLADISPVPVEGLQRALDALVDSAVLVPMATPERYSFRHALVRDLAYQSLLRRSRRTLHAAAAASLSELGGVAEEIAQHWMSAQRPDEALTWWEAAADAAAQRIAPQESIALLHRALEAAAEDPDSARSLEDRARLTARLATRMRFAELHADALPIVDAILQEIRTQERPPSAIEAELYTTKGNLHFWIGDSAGCKAAHTKAIEVARSCGALEQEAKALGGLGDAAYAQLDFALALERFEECVELCAAHGFKAIEAANLPMVAFTTSLMLEVDRSKQASERAIALAQETRSFRGETLACIALGAVYAWRGEPAKALVPLERALDLAVRMGSTMFEYEALYTSALCQPDAAAAEAIVRPLVEREDAKEWLRFMAIGYWAMVAEDPDSVVRRVLDSIAIASVPEFTRVLVAVSLTEAATRVADIALLEEVIDYMSMTLPDGIPQASRALARARAVLAFRTDPTAKNRAALEAIAEEDRQIPYVICLDVMQAVLDGADFVQAPAPPILSRA